MSADWRAKRRAKALREIQRDKHLGKAVSVMRAAEVKTPYHIARYTGLLSVDTQIHLPAGTVIQLHGKKATGKSSLAQQLMGQIQKKYGEDASIGWATLGYKPDLEHWRMCGVTVELSPSELAALGYEDPEDAPESVRGHTIGNIDVIDLGDSEEARKAPAEALMSAALRMVESGAYQMVVVEELGSGETKRDVTKDLHEEMTPGAWAKLMADFLKKYYTRARIPLPDGEPNETNVVVINPVRAVINSNPGGRGPTEQATSGYALEHAMAINIKLASSRPKGGGTHKEIYWEVRKAKHGGHEGASGTLVWNYENGFDTIQDTFDAAVAIGTVVRSGAFYRFMDQQEKFQGGARAVKHLRENPALLADLYEATVEVANGRADLESVLDGSFWGE